MTINNNAKMQIFHHKATESKPMTQAESISRSLSIQALLNKAKSGQKLTRAEMAKLRELAPDQVEKAELDMKLREEDKKIKLRLKIKIEESRIKREERKKEQEKEREQEKIKRYQNRKKYDTFKLKF